MKNKKLRGRFGKPLQNIAIASNVVRLRSYYNIKQEVFAKSIGVSTRMLSQYETGKEYFPVGLVKVIADKLQVKQEQLLQTLPPPF